MNKNILAILVLSLSLTVSSVSAISFRFNEEGDVSPFGKIVSSLFATGKTGAALVGEVSDIATTTFTLTTKQKNYIVAYTAETKVRKLGLPAKMSEVQEGDKISVVSSIVKPEAKYAQAKLRAKIISILSQEGELKHSKKEKEDEKGGDATSATENRDEEKEGASSSILKDQLSEKENKEDGESVRLEKNEKKEAAPATLRK